MSHYKPKLKYSIEYAFITFRSGFKVAHMCKEHKITTLHTFRIKPNKSRLLMSAYQLRKQRTNKVTDKIRLNVGLKALSKEERKQLFLHKQKTIYI